jgi:ankyrin repeat protein
LHHAVIKGNEAMITLLRKQGADDTLMDAQGKTAQDYLRTPAGIRMGKS